MLSVVLGGKMRPGKSKLYPYELGYGDRSGQQKQPRGGVLTGGAPREGGRRGSWARRRGVGLATPGLCWYVC